MQHPDESTIHAWLDNALNAGEASELEAHVAGCADCQAKVAEARGLISASSRILSSLDDVPRNVIPAAPARPRFDRPLLRAAALLVIVGGGGFVLTRIESTDATLRTVTNDRPVIYDSVQSSPATTTAASPGAGAASRMAAASTQSRSNSRVVTTDSQSVAPARRVAVSAPTAAVGNAVAADLGAASNTMTADAQAAFRVAPPAVGLATEAAVVVKPLRIVRSELTPQGRRTSYEVTPNHVAELLERDHFAGESLPAKVASQRAATARGSVGASAARADAVSSTPMLGFSGANTIDWVDETSGRTLVLSGPFSIAELLELKQRIVALRSRR